MVPNFQLNSLELLTQTEAGSLVFNTFLDRLYQTQDLSKALSTATEVSNRNGFTLPFWFMVGLDVLKLIR